MSRAPAFSAKLNGRWLIRFSAVLRRPYPADLYNMASPRMVTAPFRTETRKRLLLRCRHKCYLAPVGFHHYILLVSVARASSAGNMMAVHQTPFNYSWYGHSKDFHLRSLRSTIIYCSVATIPLSGPYSCIFASFSLDAVGQRL